MDNIVTLRQNVMRDLASFMDNADALKRVSKLLKKLKKEEKESCK